MTHNELQARVEELEALANSESDSIRSEELARELLAILPNGETKRGAELRSRTLLSLSRSIRQRGDATSILDLAEEALAHAETSQDKRLIAEALNNIGVTHELLSNGTMALNYFSQSLVLNEEIGNKRGEANNDNNIGIVYIHVSDYTNAIEYISRALALYEELGHKRGVASANANIGLIYQHLSNYAKALEYYSRALALNEELLNNRGIQYNLTHIGNIYSYLFNYPKALEYYRRAITISEELGDKRGIATNTGNIGVVHQQLSDDHKALKYLSRALALHEELGDKRGVTANITNIGNVHKAHSDYPLALVCYNRALDLAEELGDNSLVAGITNNIGMIFSEQRFEECDVVKAEQHLFKSIELNEKIGNKSGEYQSHKLLVELYKKQELWKNALSHFEKYHDLEKEVQSEEAKKQATLIEQQKLIAEREKEIAIAKARADAQMSATTSLLYKVLPESVATRMIRGDNEIADYFTSVSILFADIAGFTPLSADMPAIIVVRFLNFVFAEFDRIIKKHGCEKIKTIGDGYMAVCGAPIECADHAERLAAAALEMQEPIILPDSIREYLPDDVRFGVRIGLHTGSVVAGVIGEERFVYDIYSDAVNTAARMESHGEVNKIHCSSDFFRHMQNRFAMTKNTTHGLSFMKRGELEIKGKGMMRTYFMEKA